MTPAHFIGSLLALWPPRLGDAAVRASLTRLFGVFCAHVVDAASGHLRLVRGSRLAIRTRSPAQSHATQRPAGCWRRALAVAAMKRCYSVTPSAPAAYAV